MLGLIGAGLNIKISRQKKFYCAEFVKYALEETNIENGLPELIIPDHFNHLQKSKPVYEGLLRKYAIPR